MNRSTVVPPSQSAQSPRLKYMPRPKCQGMRPKRSEPSSVSISPQARLAKMLPV
jgi:hypothetical protein